MQTGMITAQPTPHHRLCFCANLQDFDPALQVGENAPPTHWPPGLPTRGGGGGGGLAQGLGIRLFASGGGGGGVVVACTRWRWHIQHSPNTPTTGLRERGNDTSKSTGRSGRQNAATRRNMRREERVTVQGPVCHTGGGGGAGTRPWYQMVCLVGGVVVACTRWRFPRPFGDTLTAPWPIRFPQWNNEGAAVAPNMRVGPPGPVATFRPHLWERVLPHHVTVITLDYLMKPATELCVGQEI